MDLLVSACLFVLLTVTGVVAYLPQLLRLLRGGSAEGASVPAALAGSVNGVAWVVYLTAEQAWPLLATNLLATAVWLVWTATVLRRRGVAGAWQVPAAWSALLVSVGVVAPAEVLGWVLGLGCLFTFVPQVHAAWTAPSVAALSAPTWWIVLVHGVGWLQQSVPGLLVGGMLFGVVSVVGAGAILLAIGVRRAPTVQVALAA